MQNYSTVGITVAEVTAKRTAGIWTGFCVLFATGPISNSAEVPYSVSETLPCALSHIASPILFCMGRQKMLVFTLWGLFIWQRRAGKQMSCKNYRLLYCPGPVSRGEAALQAVMDQWSCMRASGLCGLHLLESSSVQLGAKASGREHSYASCADAFYVLYRTCVPRDPTLHCPCSTCQGIQLRGLLCFLKCI